MYARTLVLPATCEIQNLRQYGVLNHSRSSLAPVHGALEGQNSRQDKFQAVTHPECTSLTLQRYSVTVSMDR